MKINTRYFEIELHSGLVYVRIGSLDACLARGQGFTFGRTAGWLS